MNEVLPLDWSTIFLPASDLPAGYANTLSEYFTQFAALPMRDGDDGKHELANNPCLRCGENLTPGLAGLFSDGGFTWGLVHGEGRCAKCGWPARAYHRPKDAEGKELFFLNLVLQYHPDFVTETKE